jgi:membrane-associated phospholipid phosphatase
VTTYNFTCAARSPSDGNVVVTRQSLRAVCLALSVLCLLCSAASSVRADDSTAVRWQPEWRRVNLFEGLALIPVGAALWAIETQWPALSEPNWQGGILADDFARELLRGRSPELQRTAGKLSDILFMGGAVLPILLDLGVTLGVHRQPDLAWQMFLIDMQSLLMAGLVSLTSEHAVGRARPFVEDCTADGVVTDEQGRIYQRCGSPSETKSFFSGHASATATVAGLTCIHHQRLPLYGGGFADLAPCLVSIAMSVTTGMGRIIADKHWTSDVMLGWSVGALSGYVLPALIHYGWSNPPRRCDTSQLRWLPLAAPGGFGLSMIGKLD